MFFSPQPYLYDLYILYKSFNSKQRHQLRWLLFISILAAASEVFNIGALLPFLKFISKSQANINAPTFLRIIFEGIPHNTSVIIIGFILSTLFCTATLLRLYAIHVQLKLSALIASDLGAQVFTSVLNRPFAWHINSNTSSILSNLTKDVDQIYAIVQALLLFIVNIFVVILLSAVMLIISPFIMLSGSAIIIGFYGLIFYKSRIVLYDQGTLVRESYQRSIKVAQEALGGIRDIILDKTQDVFRDTYNSHNKAYRLASSRINQFAQYPRYALESFIIILSIGSLLILTALSSDISKVFPLYFTLMLGAYKMLQPLQQCFSSLASLKSNQSSLQSVLPYLTSSGSQDIKISNLNHRYTTCNKDMNPIVSLQNVSFNYDPQCNPAIENIHFEIKRGEKIAIVGLSGSGKTTLCDIVLGLLSPTAGKVYEGGNDIYASNNLLENWRSKVSHVPQNIYLSDSSIAENIAFGIPVNEISLERVINASKYSIIHEYIASLPNGYCTPVGERGIKLSGGQRQRIGIARALYKQSDLIVFDEATSALDVLTESLVIESICSIPQKPSLIIITHRLNLLRVCDRIVFIDNGIITGIGSFHELLISHTEFQKFVSNSQL